MSTVPLNNDYTSDLISGDGFDEGTGTLAIRFRSNGATYHYNGCSPDMWKAYSEAESKGKFFHNTIKKNLQGVKQ